MEKLNILTFPTHPRYDSLMDNVGHNFYRVPHWDAHDLFGHKEALEKFDGVEFDLIMSQNKEAHYPNAARLQRDLNIPIISLEHTLPRPEWQKNVLDHYEGKSGEMNVYISDFSARAWGVDSRESTRVIKHGLDTEQFHPSDADRNPEVLSVVHDWIKRDWCCGYNLYEEVIEGFPRRIVGDTPGLSTGLDTEGVIKAYQESRIFLNTSLVSPIPCSLLEAMACGCAVVTTDRCMIPEVVQNGVNGFITNDVGEMREYLRMLLDDEDLAKKMGDAARKTIVENYSLEQFVENWENVLEPYLKTKICST